MTQTVRLESLNVSERNLPDRLRFLIELLSKTNNSTPLQAHQILQKAQIKQEDLMSWSTFNHPVTHSYGRQLVYNGGYFEIMVMSWLPGDISAIHDHGATEWGAVQCFGTGSHWVYQLRDNFLQTQESKELTSGQIIRVNHNLVHQMGNLTEDYFLSLHVYGVNRKIQSITGNARVFDLLEESTQYTDGGVFFCLPEEDISRRQFGLNADFTSTLRHHQQMQKRVRSILQTSRFNLEDWQVKAIKLEREIAKLSN